MKYKEIDLNSYKLHLIKTDKFKSILFKIVFREEIKKENITMRNILVDNLVASTKDYPTRKLQAIKKQDLYGADIYGYNKRIGNHLLTEISMSILNPKYTEDSMLEESIAFFHSIIFNPNVCDNKFNKEIFDIVIENNIADIKSIKENTGSYAITRLKENMDDKNPFSYRMIGYLDDINKINSSNLYTSYKNMLNNNLIDLYVIGNFNEEEIESLIKKYFKFKTIKKEKQDINLSYKNYKKTPKEVTEESNLNQSILAIGCSLNRLNEKEKKYILTLYNIILGNSPDSKLFKNVREKHSLAYSISSSFKRFDDVMIINAGISSKNYQEVIKLIKKEMLDIKNKNFTKEDLDKAKELFISVLNDINEYPESILDYYFSLEYLNTKNLKTQIKNITSITEEDIVKVAKKIKFDTIYLLKEKQKD